MDARDALGIRTLASLLEAFPARRGYARPWATWSSIS